MDLRTLGMLFVAVGLLALAAILLLGGEEELAPRMLPAPNFTVHELDRAGGYGYAWISWNGSAAVQLLALNESPKNSIHILRDPAAISADDFDAFVDGFTFLQKYGYEVSVVSLMADVRDGIYIIPTGAMPAYALEGLAYPNRTTIYIGQKNLLIQNGIKEQNWYTALREEQKQHLILYETTLDELYEANASMLPQTILEQTWSLTAKRTIRLNSTGTETIPLPLDDAQYLRLLYVRGNTIALYDSAELPPMVLINASPSALFPWEKSEISMAINRTNGSAFFQALRNGREVHREPIGRITEPNLFFFRLQFQEPGEYLLRVFDGEGIQAGGRLHVKELGIRYTGSRGDRYFFNITVDNEPLDGEAFVRLNHSTQSGRFFIRDGELTVPARLPKGTNIFLVTLEGQTFAVPVENRRENILGLYLQWGIPGLAIVLAVYIFARLARRPVYRIRLGAIGKEIRKDVHLERRTALGIFTTVCRELRLDAPVTAREFAGGLKRHVTNGADITDGNVEALLKQLADSGAVESYRGYYQLKGTGDVKRNTLHRMAREALIAEGIPFDVHGTHFRTRDFEIGFFGEKFEEKGYVLIEDSGERERIYASLSPSERARVQLQERNGKITLVTIEMLRQIL